MKNMVLKKHTGIRTLTRADELIFHHFCPYVNVFRNGLQYVVIDCIGARGSARAPLTFSESHSSSSFVSSRYFLIWHDTLSVRAPIFVGGGRGPLY